MYGCKSWTIKKSEYRRIDAFKLWCERPLNSKWIKSVSPKGNQPWIFTERSDAEVEAPNLWSPDAKSRLIEKTLTLGKTEGRRRRGWQDERVDGIPDSMDMSLSKLREMVKDREPDLLQSVGSSRVGRDWTRVGDRLQSPGPLPSLEVTGGLNVPILTVGSIEPPPLSGVWKMPHQCHKSHLYQFHHRKPQRV